MSLFVPVLIRTFHILCAAIFSTKNVACAAVLNTFSCTGKGHSVKEFASRIPIGIKQDIFQQSVPQFL